jgi:alginate O-acetyltransferase complex protein AlgI
VTALAWAAMVALGAIADRATAGLDPIARTSAIASALLLGAKLVVLARDPLPLGRALAFTCLWPGMKPAEFRERAPRAGAASLVGRGLARAAAGGLALAAARAVSPWSRTLAGSLALVGCSLVLHFGVLNVAAGALRAAGFDVGPLFRAPLLATSLGEFWGRRWNLAFSDLARAAIHRPLARRSPALAVAAVFAFSGLAHEAAISLPVRAGFGGPFAYFALQGALVLAERRLFRGAPGSAWTLGALALPLPLLFQPTFVSEVVLPLAGA